MIKNMSTKKHWDSPSFDKNEKKGAVAVHQISKTKKLNGHNYKKWMKSLLKKSKGSDVSLQKNDKLFQDDENVTVGKSSKEVETSNGDSPQQHERVEFVLRRVKDSDHAERTNDPNHLSQTKEGDCCNDPSPEPECDDISGDASENQTNLDISGTKEKLAQSSITANFVEYWVPVELSSVQTEQYCGSLFSNSKLLCTDAKHDLDSAKILHDILISTRKCCDHPYLVDRSLHTSLMQGIPQPEQLDAEIKLSSKLHLLLKTLLEIKKRGLRALILYQSLGGSGMVSIGHILDDIIHEKFGEDSFVRIPGGGGLSRSQRNAILTEFNYIRSGKFVCLMETRACVPSIKLSNIDTVIFFNSDWDPMSDMRALKRIDLTSQFEQVKVFRLYSSLTVEEKVLILTKQGRAPESNTINMKQSTCHRLLSWGVTNLFDKLDEFHNFDTINTKSVISSGDSFVENVFTELLYLLPNTGKNNDCKHTSFILKVEPVGGIYPRNVTLFGEEGSSQLDNFSIVEEMIDKEPPCVLWINLLKGRQPKWKYLPSASSRTRKTVYRFDDLLKGSLEGETASKRCRKEANKTQNRDIARKSSGGKKHDHVRQKAIPSLVNEQSRSDTLTREKTPTLETPSSAEPRLSPQRNCPLPSDQLPPYEHDHVTIQNGQTSVQIKTTQPPLEDSVRPYVPVTENRREPSASTVLPTSGVGHLPQASQVTSSDQLKSVCSSLQTELERLEKEKSHSSKLHEEMKLQMKMACIQEIDQIRKKYDLLLQNSERAYAEEMKVFEARHKNVVSNKLLAEAMMEYATQDPSQEIYQLICQGVGSPIIAPTNAESISGPGQALASQAMNSTSSMSMQLHRALVGHKASPFRPMYNLPVNCFQAGYGVRAPAPYFRHTRPPVPFTAPGGRVSLLSMSGQQVMSNVQTWQSPGLR
ncbi:hypothetical protein ACJIZ3_021931 [Penstemon smallii]|uniref:Helicase C-terminal domain-containing protein n=1 Tax=Penstemon smallii TaxID=265156 RepID=A0ABD3SMU9_9LAMI